MVSRSLRLGSLGISIGSLIRGTSDRHVSSKEAATRKVLFVEHVWCVYSVLLLADKTDEKAVHSLLPYKTKCLLDRFWFTSRIFAYMVLISCNCNYSGPSFTSIIYYHPPVTVFFHSCVADLFLISLGKKEKKKGPNKELNNDFKGCNARIGSSPEEKLSWSWDKLIRKKLEISWFNFFCLIFASLVIVILNYLCI